MQKKHYKMLCQLDLPTS